MAFEVVLTSGFKRNLKKIAKKHRHILKDISMLIEEIAENPYSGTDLGQDVYKIRLSVTGTFKGKSGGARVITYVKITNETVILAEIYLKSEFDTVNVNTVLSRLIDEGYL